MTVIGRLSPPGYTPVYVVDVGNRLVVVVKDPGGPSEEVTDTMSGPTFFKFYGGYVDDLTDDDAPLIDKTIEVLRAAAADRPLLLLHPEERADILDPTRVTDRTPPADPTSKE